VIARALPPSAVAGALVARGEYVAGVLTAGVTVLAVVVAEWDRDRERRRAHHRNDRLR
jgi:hypothetical protein